MAARSAPAAEARAQRVENQPRVAGDVADRRVDLQQRDLHRWLARRRARPARASIVVRSFVTAFRPYHTMKRLVILSPNWLGDAVMALPAIADVRRAAPDASITVAARPAIAPLFQLVPEVDDTIVLPGRRAGRRRARAGARSAPSSPAGGFDAALLLPELDARGAARVARRDSRTLGVSRRRGAAGC